MLSSLKQSNSRIAGRTALVLGVLAFGGLGFPTLRWVAQRGFAGQQNSPGAGAPAENDADRDKSPPVAAGPVGAELVVADEYFPRATASERQIFTALEKPVDVDFQELALQDCIAVLSERGKIDIWIDRAKIAEEGTNLDQPVTLKLKGRRLESVLNLILQPLALAYVYDDEVLKVTTSANAAERLITRTYPVRDLYRVRERPAAPAPRKNATGDEQMPAPGSGGGQAGIGPGAMGSAGIGGQFFGGGMGGGMGGGGMMLWAMNDLTIAIRHNVQPDSWEESGSLTYVHETNSLVIRQTRQAHREILQLLRDLRAAKRLQQLAGSGDNSKTGK